MSVLFLDNMPFQDAARRMLCMDEGVRAKPYTDTAGKLTIGVGRNLDDVGLNEEEIRVLLDNDIVRARSSVVSIFGANFVESLSPFKQLALLNLAFNLGEAEFRKFTTTITLIKAQKWKEAAERLRYKTKYGKQLPRRAERVARMMSEDVFPYQDD